MVSSWRAASDLTCVMPVGDDGREMPVSTSISKSPALDSDVAGPSSSPKEIELTELLLTARAGEPGRAGLADVGVGILSPTWVAVETGGSRFDLDFDLGNLWAS